MESSIHLTILCRYTFIYIYSEMSWWQLGFNNLICKIDAIKEIKMEGVDEDWGLVFPFTQLTLLLAPFWNH